MSGDSKAGASSRIGFSSAYPVVAASLVYFALFAQAGLNQPFLPVWLSSRGLTETEIATVISLPLLLRIMVTPVIGSISDRTGSRAMVVRILALIVLALALMLSQARSFGPILALATLMMLFGQAIPPIVDASVLSLIRSGVARDFGRMRLWGSGSFATATLIGGFILGWGGPDAVFVAYICAVVLQIGASFILPSAAQQAAPVAKKTRLDLHKRPLLLVVFIVAALPLASQATFNSFGSIHLREIGFAERTVGMLWALATSSEIAMFWAGPILARRMSAFSVLALACGAAVLRWSVMSLDPGLVITMLLQMLHAATFSCSYLGLMRFVQVEVSDAVGARAQGAFVTMLGLMTAATTLAMGPIYREIGAGAFMASAILPATGLALLLGFRSRLRAAEAEGAARELAQRTSQ
ncbi:MFS transporter [Terrarubrum flagellatum]|uniref:MFS transporter n=1 Tax=Terrirubrum flagellatum TaxID=2895980 RepID=UPI003144E771